MMILCVVTVDFIMTDIRDARHILYADHLVFLRIRSITLFRLLVSKHHSAAVSHFRI